MRFAFLQRSLKVILEGDMGKRWKGQSLLLSCGSSEAPPNYRSWSSDREDTEMNTEFPGIIDGHG